jgi:citrate lyase beta subunit
MAAAAAEGRGAVAVDGKMVDLANLASARRILSMAGMLL